MIGAFRGILLLNPNQEASGSVISYWTGFFPGLINGLLGTGGGILAVALFQKQGASQPKAQASALALMLPLSCISLVVYGFSGNIPAAPWLFFLPCALLGAALGAYLLKKLPPRFLRLLFALLMLSGGLRILLRR